MGCMLDSDWSRQFLLRCDWLVLSVASYTTNIELKKTECQNFVMVYIADTSIIRTSLYYEQFV